MSPIEMGPLRPAGAVDARAVRTAAGASDSTTATTRPVAPAAAAPATAAPAVVRSDALNAGTPPVNADRVAEIRKAIETGSYPVIPTTVADAIIAAGLLLRKPAE